MVPGSSLFPPSPTCTCALLKTCTWQSLGECALNETSHWFMLVVAGTEAVCLKSGGQPT